MLLHSDDDASKMPAVNTCDLARGLLLGRHSCSQDTVFSRHANNETQTTLPDWKRLVPRKLIANGLMGKEI